MSRYQAATAILAGLFMATQAPARAAAGSPEDRRQEIREEQKDLKGRKSALEGQKKNRITELRTLDRKLDSQRQELRAQERELGGLRGREQDLGRESRELDGKMGEMRAHLATRMRSLYEVGLLRPILFLLESSSPAELYGRITFLDRMAAAERALIRRAQSTLDRRIAAQKELKLRKADIEKNLVRQNRLQVELADNRRRKTRTLAEISRDLKDVETLIAEHDEENRRLGILVAEAERQKRLEDQALSGAFLALRRGTLEWPVQGRLIRGFGKQQLAHNAWLKSDGMEIEAPYGAPVRAVAAGDVLFADWHLGQGKIVILRHGGSDTSLYLHLDSLAVTLGQKVVAGQVIGAVGDTGTMSGQAALGFQIRHKAMPQDPAGYLKPR